MPQSKRFDAYMLKAKLLGCLDKALHGELPAYVVNFRIRRDGCDWESVQISRGSSNDGKGPYRMDYRGRRDMYNRYLENAWDYLVRDVLSLSFDEIEMIGGTISEDNNRIGQDKNRIDNEKRH